MTTKNTAILVCALLVLSIPAVAAAQASVLRINESGAMDISSANPAITYSFQTVNSQQQYVAEVNLEGFLICNEFADVGNTANTSLYVRPVHGAWLIGYEDAPGVQGSFTRVHSLSYDHDVLGITACGVEGFHPGCFNNSAPGHAKLQCYTADAHGQSVVDTRSIFASGFDFQANQGNSWVSISIDQIPTAPGQQFVYTVTYHVPNSSAVQLTGGGSHTNATQSYSANTYALLEGYDRAVFSSCNVPLGSQPNVGTPISQAGTFSVTRRCWMHNPNMALPGDVPVVTAALFTSPGSPTAPAAPAESTYADNVAFGYPVLPQ